MYKYKILHGRFADGGVLEDSAEAEVLFLGGPHKGHRAYVSTAKFNCGAYGATVECECGNAWANAMYGCWQNYHQRPESGDSTLAIF
jgi:hypothetical protein